MRKLLGLIFIVVFTLTFLIGAVGSDQKFGVSKSDLSISKKPVYVEDEIVVAFKKGFSKDLEKQLTGEFGLIKKEQKHYSELFGVFKKGRAEGDIRSIMERVKGIPGVEFVEQNSYMYAFALPNDPYRTFQWHMTKIGMEQVWGHEDGAGVTVAVIDTGVRQSLSDMANTSFVAGWDYVNNDSDPDDDHGHGSHVAGTVAQSTNNGVGVTGVAGKASVMAIKVLDSSGGGYSSRTALGVRWATDHGADVINLSLGGSGYSQTLKNAVDYAWNNGVVVVCAAGNDNVSTPFYPAAYSNSISVSATDYNDNRAPYSNYGSTIDITAPGGDVTVDLNGDGYGDGILQQTINNGQPAYMFYQGTSMACPHVAGVAAMMKSVNSSLTNAQIKSKLYSTATDIGPAGFDNEFGWGLLNANAAMLSANTNPVANFGRTIVQDHVQFYDVSSDANGEIVAWHWNFGDMTSSAERNPTHVYQMPGTYSPTITVTDNHGGISHKSRTISIDPFLIPSVYTYVKDISCTKSFSGSSYTLTARIKVFNQNHQPVSGATVNFCWDEFPASICAYAVTDSQGNAYHTITVPGGRAYRIRIIVSNIIKQPYTYFPRKNVMERFYVDIP